MSREEFQQAVVGKSLDQVIANVGRPVITQMDNGGRKQRWYYDRVTRDSITGKVDGRVQLIIENGMVEKVNF